MGLFNMPITDQVSCTGWEFWLESKARQQISYPHTLPQYPSIMYAPCYRHLYREGPFVGGNYNYLPGPPPFHTFLIHRETSTFVPGILLSRKPQQKPLEAAGVSRSTVVQQNGPGRSLPYTKERSPRRSPEGLCPPPSPTRPSTSVCPCHGLRRSRPPALRRKLKVKAFVCTTFEGGPKGAICSTTSQLSFAGFEWSKALFTPVSISLAGRESIPTS